MSSSRSERLNRNRAIAAYDLYKTGLNSAQIATQMGYRDREQAMKAIGLGQRLVE